jgi:hypothetical protein
MPNPHGFTGDVLAGFATADITPPLNLEIAGFGPFMERKATAIHDPLMAHAMVLVVGGKRFAIVGCDVLAVSREFTQSVRREVEAGTGIPGPHIMVSATHTHSGPAIPRLIGWGQQDEDYLSKLPGLVAGSIIAASRNVQSVEVYYGEVPVEGIGQNREWPGGPIDKRLRVLKFMHGDQLVGFIVHHSVHNVIFSEQMHAYTADLTGVAMAKVVKEHPGSVGIYLQGSCGDINPVDFVNNLSPDECVQLLEKLSARFADYVRDGLKNGSKMSVDSAEMDTQEISLPLVPTDRALMLRQMNLADQLLGTAGTGVAFLLSGLEGQASLPAAAQRWLRFSRETAEAVFERHNQSPLTEMKAEIQVLRIQDLLVLANPGELFFTFSEQISSLFRSWKVWVTGYTHDFVGYFPTPDRYDVQSGRFSYPAYFVPMIKGDFRFREDVGDVLVQHLIGLGRSLVSAGKPKPKKRAHKAAP